MKKILTVILVMCLMSGVATLSFAKSQKKYDRIIARITSIDATAKTIVVKDEKSGATRTVKVSEKAVSQINVGDRIRIKLNPGTNVSAGVRVLKDKTKVEPQVETPVEPVAVEPAPVAAEKK